jgi:hypothetical protein
MRVLGELAGATRHAPYAQAVLDQARRLAAACAVGFPDADRDLLNDRLAAVEQAVAGFSAQAEPVDGLVADQVGGDPDAESEDAEHQG